MMANIIAVLVIILLVGAAVAYIVKAKKRGVKCIGCPDSGHCSAAKNSKNVQSGCGCSCGCHGKK